MTLHDLYEHLLPTFPASVQKDLKTAVHTLAQALKYADAKACPLTACLHPMPYLYELVETHLILSEKGPHTIRNTKNNLSRLFRLADAHGLFSLLPATPTRRFPYRAKPHNDPLLWKPDGSYLRRAQWPLELEQAFTAFHTWATDPLVDNRDVTLRKRQATMKFYQRGFETYFGYLSHVCHINPVTFNHLFDITLIKNFVNWHINEKFKRPTMTVHLFLTQILAILNQYHHDPKLHKQVKAFKKTVPRYTPIYDKNDSWIPLDELRRIALAISPSERQKKQMRMHKKYQNGRVLAAHAGISLMLQLWTYIPYRQRNMREMHLEKNLYKTSEGQWRIRFTGQELKVSYKRHTLNQFDLPFPPTLVPLLEVYLTEWRPRLQGEQPLSHVFFNTRGKPYTMNSLLETTKSHIYAHTGKSWHPHIIRTVWATEWIQSTGDFMTAAIMLNDRLETVIERYAHLRDEGVAEKAYQWVQSRVNGH